MNVSRITYHEPKDKFKKINMDVIMRYEPIVVGIYCKLVTISSGKSLSVDFLSKKLNISKERMRKTIVFLEQEGYIVRTPIRDENGRMSGWNYGLFAEPVDKDKRTRAGLKNEETPSSGVSRVMGSPCYGFSDNTEKGEDNIIIDNDIYNNNIDRDKDIDKKPTYVGKKPATNQSLFPEQSEAERKYEEYMRKKYPYIMKMDQPLTMQQAKKLKEDYGEEIVLDVFDAMDNKRDLVKSYRSAYKTAIKWCKLRQNDTRP